MITTRHIGAVALAGLTAIAVVACSSSAHPAKKASGSHLSVVAPHSTTGSTGAPTPTTSSSPSATGTLSGTWNGQYGGSYSGTFVLNWTQTGSALSGTIKLSNPASTFPIHGSLSGTSISFGTVGSTNITYTGAVSGTSMSGHYQVAAGGGGSWSAAKP